MGIESEAIEPGAPATAMDLRPSPAISRDRPLARLLVGAAVAGLLWVGLSLAVGRPARANPQQYADALQYALGKELQEPGYTIRTLIVQPYRPVELIKSDRIMEFQVWITYAHRGQSHVLYLIIFPDGEIVDQAAVASIGDTGGLLG